MIKHKQTKIAKTLLFAALSSLSLVTSVSVFAQDRVDAVLPKVSTKIYGSLTKATGWTRNPEEQWVSRPNKIPAYLESRFASLIDYQRPGLGVDNFISYQIRRITINDTVYGMLVKQYNDGRFQYPAIEKDWEEYRSCEYYIYDTTQDLKLKQLTPESVNIVRLKTRCLGRVTRVKALTFDQDIEKDVANMLKANLGNKPNDSLTLQVAYFPSKNIARFMFYQQYSYNTDWDSIRGITGELKVKQDPSKISSHDKKLFGTKELFEYCYFETSLEDFNNFIPLK